MPGCFEDIFICGAGIASLSAYHTWQSGREDRRRIRVARAKEVAHKTLENSPDLDQYASSRVQLPLGSDTNAVQAMQAVQTYLDGRPNAIVPAKKAGPGCSVGLVKMTGFVTGPAGPEVEIGVCEDMKKWLRSAASGAVSQEDVESRLQYCRELLMEPETFSESAFLRMLAEVCEQLDLMYQRKAGSVRACSEHIRKICSDGIKLIDSTLPLLILGITEFEDGQLPQISTQGLIQSAGRYRNSTTAVEDGLQNVWNKDYGRMLAEVLLTQHFQSLYNVPDPFVDKRPKREGAGPLVDTRLDILHKWIDGRTQGSGLGELFISDDHQVYHQYLDLYTTVDNLAFFLSSLETFRNLADIGGDAGMLSLRSSFHHLLDELEQAVQKLFQQVSTISKLIVIKVVELMKGDEKTLRGRRTWLERQQLIDTTGQSKAYKSLISAASELRYLTSESRLPHLQERCHQALQQIADVLQSAELMDRCSEKPPTFAIGDVVVESGQHQTLALTGPSTAAVQAAIAWSVEQQVPANPSEFSKDDSQEDIINLHSKADLGQLVDDLNRGKREDAVGVAIVEIEDTGEIIALYNDQTASKEDALVRIGSRRTYTELHIDELDEEEQGVQTMPKARTNTEPTTAAAAQVEPPQEDQTNADATTAEAAQVEPAQEKPLEDMARVDSGAKRLQAVVPAATCDKCGFVFPGQEKFCPSCGAERQLTTQDAPSSFSVQAAPEEEVLAYKVILLAEYEQKRYYDRLHAAVLPQLGNDDEMLTKDEVLVLLRRSGLPDNTLKDIIKNEVGRMTSASTPKVDVTVLKKLGKAVARAQAGKDVAAIPQLRGIVWNSARGKIQVTEPLM